MQSETGFPSCHQLKSYVASKSRLKLAARAVLSADAGFLVLESDHRPLEYLQTSHCKNPRIMRWSLSLQPYRYTVRYIKGSDNVVADNLSRSRE